MPFKNLTTALLVKMPKLHWTVSKNALPCCSERSIFVPSQFCLDDLHDTHLGFAVAESMGGSHRQVCKRFLTLFFLPFASNVYGRCFRLRCAWQEYLDLFKQAESEMRLGVGVNTYLLR